MTPHQEWVADALDAADDEALWRAQRNVDLGLECGWVSGDEMRARWAADRAEVEAQCHRDHLREVAERAVVQQSFRDEWGPWE